MLLRLSSVVFLGLFFVSNAMAQTVRFDTNVGNFDVVLNPNGISGLQGHVDNFLQYVEGGFYDNLLINRTPNNFVMQLGRFQISNRVDLSSKQFGRFRRQRERQIRSGDRRCRRRWKC